MCASTHMYVCVQVLHWICLFSYVWRPHPFGLQGLVTVRGVATSSGCGLSLYYLLTCVSVHFTLCGSGAGDQAVSFTFG